MVILMSVLESKFIPLRDFGSANSNLGSNGKSQDKEPNEP
jgi:hypothetical protein